MLVLLLIVLAIVTGVAGAVIKGAFWLFVVAALFAVGAFVAGRASSQSH
jgi:hypothetical protein